MYEKSGSHLQYFVPNIAFSVSTSVPMRAIDIGAASGTHGEFVCVKACDVTSLRFSVATEAVSGTTTAPTVVFAKRVTPGTDTGGSAVGTLTIPSGTAIGRVVLKDITPVNFQVGDVMLISWTIGVGTPTGEGIPSWICQDDPEISGNNSDIIVSV
jgi:hypothetical protein